MSVRGEMAPRRRSTSPPPASLPDDDDMLREILLRLPPRPSSLPRASRVCKRWRRLVADPRFQRRFRDHHHGKPPLLGFFFEDYRSCPFVPVLDRPDRIPRDRFSMSRREDNRIVDCRHGLVLFLSGRPPRSPSVWDPVARKQRCLTLPPELVNDRMYFFNRAVLRPARGQGRRSSQFQVALVAYDDRGETRASAWVYSSETGIWSKSKSLQLQSSVPMDESSTLIGNSLYWLHTYAGHVVQDHRQYFVLEFDLNSQSLAVTELPAHVEPGYHTLRIMPAEDGGLGFIHLSLFNAQLWKRKPDSDGSAVWVLDRAIEFGELRSTCKGDSLTLVGFDEESNAILVSTASGVFVVYLQSMEFKKVSNTVFFFPHYPYECCYAAGTGIVDVHGRDEVLKYMGDARLLAHVCPGCRNGLSV
ncbi:hypothetical protein ACQJBY_024870 [Aegilops geniculata]